jgi:hypothetical protein
MLTFALLAYCSLADVKALWRDQDQEGAFRGYVELLSEVDSVESRMTKEEEEVYGRALDIYLKERVGGARKIDELFSAVIEAHPDWAHLGFVVAAAKGNLGEFPSFFELFYNSYRADPNHFLASKIKAVLHIKLFERARWVEERERQREEVLKALHAAEKAFPGDYSLYEMEIGFTRPEKKEEIKREILNKILELSIIPPRADTLYFVKMAISLRDKELIDRWMQRAKKGYPNSRSLEQIEVNGYQNTR